IDLCPLLGVLVRFLILLLGGLVGRGRGSRGKDERQAREDCEATLSIQSHDSPPENAPCAMGRSLSQPAADASSRAEHYILQVSEDGLLTDGRDLGQGQDSSGGGDDGGFFDPLDEGGQVLDDFYPLVDGRQTGGSFPALKCLNPSTGEPFARVHPAGA